MTWYDLTSSEATYPHVRLYELPSNDDDSLSFFLSTLANETATVAIVLINSKNNLKFSRKFTTMTTDEQSLSVPVVMVAREVGAELVGLARENFREVEAMMEVPPDLMKRETLSPLNLGRREGGREGKRGREGVGERGRERKREGGGGGGGESV